MDTDEKQAAAPRRVTLRCNDKPVTPGQPARVRPGAPNHLAVTIAGTAGPVRVRAALTAPDGHTRAETVAPTGGRAVFALGPLCAPAVYEYEHGLLFRRGYRLDVTVEAGGDLLARFTMAAVCSQEEEVEWLLPGAPDRCLYNDGYIPAGGTPAVGSATGSWNPFGVSAAAMEPPLQLRLDPAVLADQDRLTVCWRTRPAPPSPPLAARLLIRDRHGKEMVAPQTVNAKARWRCRPVPAAGWPAGEYSITLQPLVDGRCWEDGPRLVYRRAIADADQVPLSPYAPFALRRDRARPMQEITRWPENLPAGWAKEPSGDGETLFCVGDPAAAPVVLAPGLSGFYAVFAETVNTMLIRVGDETFARQVPPPESAAFGPVFVTAADLTGRTLEFQANDLEGLRQALGEEHLDSPRLKRLVSGTGSPEAEIRPGIRRLRLVPVTGASVEALYARLAEPPARLRGVDDWWCYFRGWDRTGPQQLEAILHGQRELGLATLNWAIGRSWVQYPSRLPDARLFPCAPLTADLLETSHPHFVAWARAVSECDCLAYPLERRGAHRVRLQAWLAMNRHYGPQAHGGIFTSPWARAHPAFRQGKKDPAQSDASRLEYFFPEVRRERLDILEEAAAAAPDGLVIGCCRQPPLAGYNAALVAAWREKTGRDPTTLDIDDGQPYLDWIQWQAGFFTEMLRDLSARLRTLETKTGRRVPVTARVPGAGLRWNLAQGIDLRTWVAEGLVDELQVDPLHSFAPGEEASHDIRPYLSLGRTHGIPVLGGVNGTTGAARGTGAADYSPVPGLRRAIGLLRAGVDGIEIYEAEIFAAAGERRWLIPLWGDRRAAAEWLAASNLEAVFPVSARNAALGHDNHWFGGETMRGARGLPRGAQRAL